MLARRNCPFIAAVVDSALVMPSHTLKPDAYVFNSEPNLETDGMPSWYYQERQKQKKKKPVRKRGGGKAAARRGTVRR